MAVWINNLANALQDKPVVILHGNVRDRYIDEQGQIYDNLTDLLQQIVNGMELRFSEQIIYDSVGQERRIGMEIAAHTVPAAADNDELTDTGPAPRSQGRQIPPSRVLAQWQEQSALPTSNRLFILYYLDKLAAYKSSYQDDEKEILLRLEKIIENIRPNHRLLMVALQDTMIPLELYTHAPKVRVLPIPPPEKHDRTAYFKHRLGQTYPHIELAANLTDGLFLHDLDAIAAALGTQSNAQEVRRIINRYRIGEQTDHWGSLSIKKLANALLWFKETEGVNGQDEAIRKVIDMLTIARAGLSGMAGGTAAKPKGVLFFAGPTGVGKTFVAKKLAKFLFSTEETFIRFDMSEFKEDHTVSKLIGSPPGYVGSDRGGMLTNAVREKPFSVLLFDEIEKASTKILDIFLQILDDGRLTDSRGQTVFFTETVIIFTSNIGTRTADSRGCTISERDDLERIMEDADEARGAIREHFIRTVERFFMYEISRPELLNRIGSSIVPFNPTFRRQKKRYFFEKSA
ncbi:MAG: ATP-dependent Clp protease ATP-binding subunit [Gammaproteobacteria bacterium]|nr:ATP-dependent Clp protease ATP-binding subunit [Gammaproteobacteria bacterium]